MSESGQYHVDSGPSLSQNSIRADDDKIGVIYRWWRYWIMVHFLLLERRLDYFLSPWNSAWYLLWLNGSEFFAKCNIESIQTSKFLVLVVPPNGHTIWATPKWGIIWLYMVKNPASPLLTLPYDFSYNHKSQGKNDAISRRKLPAPSNGKEKP